MNWTGNMLKGRFIKSRQGSCELMESTLDTRLNVGKISLFTRIDSYGWYLARIFKRNIISGVISNSKLWFYVPFTRARKRLGKYGVWNHILCTGCTLNLQSCSMVESDEHKNVHLYYKQSTEFSCIAITILAIFINTIAGNFGIPLRESAELKHDNLGHDTVLRETGSLTLIRDSDWLFIFKVKFRHDF